jgi:hypothetical protein
MDPFDIKPAEKPVEQKQQFDPTQKLASNDAWKMGLEFIDLSLGSKPKV